MTVERTDLGKRSSYNMIFEIMLNIKGKKITDLEIEGLLHDLVEVSKNETYRKMYNHVYDENRWNTTRLNLTLDGEIEQMGDDK